MRSVFVFTLVLTVLLVSPVTLAQQMRLEQCRKLQLKIQKYDELRQQGGSGSQMDAWKRNRRALEKQFRTGGCRYYRWQLK
ncbi:MAG: hypothetical protein ABJN62_13715 [Halioglobus sp.]